MTTGTAGPRMDAKKLTPREWDVLHGVVAGKTNAEIGVGLGITYETVKSYVNRLRDKLNVRTKAAIAAHAVREGMVK